MWLSKQCQRRPARAATLERPPTPRRRGLRLTLEQLEDRTVLSTFTAASVSELIADINAANAAGGSNTITLAAGKTFTLTAVDNTTDNANGTPVIVSGDNLTIVGNGDTIQRSTVTGTPLFRLLDVAGGASLSLSDLTLQGGVAGGFDSPTGGAISSLGNLSLSGVTVRNNLAQGSGAGQSARGGGIFIQGTVLYGAITPVALTMQNCTFGSNQAVGSDNKFGSGGSGLGGGLYIGHGCSASLTNVTLSSNTAQGGQGSGSFWIYGDTKQVKTKIDYVSGSGLGGGMYVVYDAATVEMHSCTGTGNCAIGGAKNSAGTPGDGIGGGLYLEPGAPVCLDAFTVAHVGNNKASTSSPNVYGSYTTSL